MNNSSNRIAKQLGNFYYSCCILLCYESFLFWAIISAQSTLHK